MAESTASTASISDGRRSQLGSNAEPMIEGQEFPIDEEGQVLIRKRKPSTTWNDFTFFHRVEKGQLKLRARCIKCLLHDYPADGTAGNGNASRHVLKSCKGSLSVTCGSLYDHDTYCMMYAQAIICHAYPLRIVEHEYLRKLHSYLNPNVRHVCRNTILKYCVREHEKIKGMLIDSMCNDVAGRISFTCDLWTACTNRGYLTLTAHYVDKHWKLRSKILNFRYCEPPHCAVNIKTFVMNLIKGWKLEGKAQSMTVDNARAMDNMTLDLRDDLHDISALPCDGKYFHVRCCAHVLNLIDQSGLKCVDSSVSKLRHLVIYVDGSDTRLTLFEQAVVDTNTDFKCKLILDVVTRWNSTYLMLRRALQAKVPLVQFSSRNLNHRDCLSDEEWKTLDTICDFLEPFYDMTELFSGTKYPTANMYFVNVAMIESFICKAHMIPELQHMAAAMMEKFESYWANYSVILSIAVVLDPRFKLEIVIEMYNHLYVDNTCDEKVNVVRQAFREMYDYYSSLSPTTNTHVSASASPSANIPRHNLLRPFKKANILQSFVANAVAARHSQSEIDSYLNAPLEVHVGDSEYDILNFWQNQAVNFPVLAIMARDVLAIPITSVASESAFSMGARTLNKYRSALLPKHVEALVTTQNWLNGYKEPEPDSDLLELSKED